jgi:hypothetical protein
MKAFSRRPSRLLLGLALSVAIGAALFFNLPRLLIAPSVEAPSDAILHFDNDPRGYSDAFVADLYARGVARKIVCLSGPLSWEEYPADYMRRHLITLGVSESDVAAFRLPIVECGGEAVPLIVDYARAQGFQSVLAVVHPSRSRLGWGRAERDFAAAGIRLAVTYSPHDRDRLVDGWWHTHWKAQRITSALIDATLDQFYAQCR